MLLSVSTLVEDTAHVKREELIVYLRNHDGRDLGILAFGRGIFATVAFGLGIRGPFITVIPLLVQVWLLY